MVQMGQDLNDLISINDGPKQDHESSALQPMEKINHRDLWNEIIRESDEKKEAAEQYRKSKNDNLEIPPHPVVEYLNETIFPVLNSGLVNMLKKVRDQENQTITEGDTYLNSLNYISEYLWNMNPLHPERRENWTNISNIEWT